MLFAIAMIGTAFLVAIGRIVGAIGVDEDVGGTRWLFALGEVDVEEGTGEPVTGLGIDRILEAGEGGLTSQIGITGQTATDQLEQGIGAQGIGIVLVLVTTGDLEDPLPDEGFQGMTDGAGSPVGQVGGEGGTQSKDGISFGQPDEPAIRGELGAVKARFDQQRMRGETGDRGCGRLGHKAPVGGRGLIVHPYQIGALCFFKQMSMNNSG